MHNTRPKGFRRISFVSAANRVWMSGFKQTACNYRGQIKIKTLLVPPRRCIICQNKKKIPYADTNPFRREGV